jgi:cytochrome c551/c552
MFFLLLALALVLVGCGGGSTSEEGAESASVGDAQAGEAIFAQTLVGTQPGCVTCHSLEPGVTMVGPSLAGIGAAAGSRVSGLSAEDYLRQSIQEPDAHVADGFSSGLMPAALADELSAQELSDLVAYLLTLE